MEPIDQIKQKLDIVAFITPYVALKQAGRNFKGLCPFHGEKTASFMVSPERQIWHCFGCSKGGDVIAFYQQIENLDFYEALKALAERTGVKLQVKEPEATKGRDRLYDINMLAAKFYHYILTKHSKGKIALEYLTLERKLLPSTITTFRLGFAPDSWSDLLHFLTKHKVSEAEAYQAGLLSKNAKGYFDYFHNRVIFPIFDARGNVVGFAGRVLDKEAKTAKYINTPETAVYIKGNTLYGLYHNKDSIREAKTILLVEGELDVLSSYQAGVRNAVAIKGTALTENQLQLLRRFATTLLLALDQDKAGQAATRRSIELAQSTGFAMRIVSLPFGKDVDDVAKQSPQALQRAIENAPPYYDWLVEAILKQYDLKDPLQKSKAVSEALPFIGAIDNEIVREHYVKQLAKRLDITFETLRRQQWRLAKQKREGRQPQERASEEPVPQETRLWQHFLSVLLQHPNPASVIEAVIHLVPVPKVPHTAEQKIYELLITAWGVKKLSMTSWLKTLPKELIPTADRLMLTELPEQDREGTGMTQEAISAAKRIRKHVLQEKLHRLTRAIIESKKDQAKLVLLNQKFIKVKEALATL